MSQSTDRKSTSNVKRKNKKNKKLKIILLLFILVILISFICFLFNFKYFDLSLIEVSGYDEYNEDLILEKYGIDYNTNIFIAYIKLKRSSIEELSYIDKIDVSISFPNKISVVISPKSSKYIAFDKDINKYYLLDELGFILKEVDISMKKEEIVLLGITFGDEIKIGTKINDIDYEKIITFCKIKDEYEKIINKGKITKANFSSSLTTITIDDKLNIVFPNDKELAYNMKFLNGILEKLEEDPIGTIDMTKSNPSFSAY